MDFLDLVVKKLEEFFAWLDGVPSVPAAIGGLLVGAVFPKSILFLSLGVAVVYTIVKFNSMRN